MKNLENPRKFKNSPHLLLLFVKITKFLEISKKITIKTIVFSNSASQQPTSQSSGFGGGAFGSAGGSAFGKTNQGGGFGSSAFGSSAAGATGDNSGFSNSGKVFGSPTGGGQPSSFGGGFGSSASGTGFGGASQNSGGSRVGKRDIF